MSATNHLARAARPQADRGRVVVWGLLARSPFGGMTWQVLHYLVGLRRLGFDVWYVEDSDSLPSHPETHTRTANPSANIAYLNRQLEQVGLADRWAYRIPRSSEVVGNVDREGLQTLYRTAEAVLNLCGAQEILPHHEDTQRLVYVETDPVVSQVEVAQGNEDRIDELDHYHTLFTYGTNLNSEDCEVPIVRYKWNPTVPPVIVDWWRTETRPANNAFTTVANWKHSAKDVAWKGQTWRWSKHEQFLRFIDLPRSVSVPMEIAVVGAGSDLERLAVGGWRTRSAWTLSEPSDYRDYVRDSLSEFSVAKHQYVAPRTGWFSDRTVCYLASGRPAVVQDTGFGSWIPTGLGLVTFTERNTALHAIESVVGDYERHSQAALEIAAEYFGAERVLSQMFEAVLAS